MTPKVLFELGHKSIIVAQHLSLWQRGDMPTFESMLVQTIEALVIHNDSLLATITGRRPGPPMSEQEQMAHINLRREWVLKADRERHFYDGSGVNGY